MRDELLKGLTAEQIVKVKECDDYGDLLQLAKDEGVELTEEQLDAVSGGACSKTEQSVPTCPICKGTNNTRMNKGSQKTLYICNDCNLFFEVGE